MDKTTHERPLFQPLETNIKQIKVAINFLTDYDGIFEDTNSNNKISFAKSFTDNDEFIQITIPKSADEIEKLNKETKGIILMKNIFKPNSFRVVQNLYQDKTSMDMTLHAGKNLTSTCCNEKDQPLTIEITKD